MAKPAFPPKKGDASKKDEKKGAFPPKKGFVPPKKKK